MPLYEFKCKKCGKVTEQMFPINEKVDYINCECGYVSNRIMSSGIFRIKGYSFSNGYSKEGE